MGSEIDAIPTILAFLGPLVTLLVYQWKNNRDTRKILDKMGVLLYDHDVLKRLYVHLTLDDPVSAASERNELRSRIEKMENFLRLLCSKRHIEDLIAEEAHKLGED
jgi:hypothetical protein